MNPQEKFNRDPYVEEEGSYLWLIFIIAAILLFFIVAGFTYSLYNNTITGTKRPIDVTNPDDNINIIFNYSDVSGNGNGIYMKNAKEMTDEIGKKLTGSENFFEFNVSGNTKGNPCKYTIALEESDTSTLNDSDVKIYLSKIQGTTETELFSIVPVYSDLENIQINGKNYKKLYTVSLDKNVSKFSQDYILRMWIREGASNYYGKTYSLKVHILAEGTGE